MYVVLFWSGVDQTHQTDDVAEQKKSKWFTTNHNDKSTWHARSVNVSQFSSAANGRRCGIRLSGKYCTIAAAAAAAASAIFEWAKCKMCTQYVCWVRMLPHTTVL